MKQDVVTERTFWTKCQLAVNTHSVDLLGSVPPQGWDAIWIEILQPY